MTPDFKKRAEEAAEDYAFDNDGKFENALTDETDEEIVVSIKIHDKHDVLLDRSVWEAHKDCGWVITYADAKRTHPYCCIYVKRPHRLGKRSVTKARIHRIITGAKPGQIVDHINGNTLDNRKSNLRIVTPTENCWNQNTLRKNKTSRFLGVSLSRGRWTAQIKIDGKQTNLGLFDTEEEAAAIRDLAVLKTRNECAKTNVSPSYIRAIIENAMREFV